MSESFIERMRELMDEIKSGKIKRLLKPREVLIKEHMNHLEYLRKNASPKALPKIQRDKIIGAIRKIETEILQILHEACNPMGEADKAELQDKLINQTGVPIHRAFGIVNNASSWRRLDYLYKRMELLTERLQYDDKARQAIGE